MKQIFLLSAAIMMALNASSQYKVEVETGEKPMSKGTQMAFTVMIPEAKTEEVEPVWKRYINNRSVGERISNLATQVGNIFKSEENRSSRDHLKVETTGGEMYVRSIEVNQISKYSMDVYARITQLAEGCQFSAFFQYTDSVFINESNVDAERLISLRSYIRDFGVEAYQSVVDDQIKEAKKEVSKQEGVLKDIESKTKREEKAITRYESNIQEYNANIFALENDIVRVNEIINLKKVSFSTMLKGTPEFDEAKKELKVLEKEKSGYFREIKSSKGKIKSKEMDIKSAKNKIEKNEQDRKNQRLVIQEKENIVDQLVKKKAGIQ
ncbi:MAG: hypothetical protein Q8P34_17875 [Bacteroidota bacterium]|nr:hypothetical protein [Bacteroidota bacterium]